MHSPTAKRRSPNPFPYDTARASPLGTYLYSDLRNESVHVAVGQPGWAPMLYALCVCGLDARRHATSSLARYVNMAGVHAGVAALEDWGTRELLEKQRWLDRFEQDAGQFASVLEKLSQDSDAARGAWQEHLFAMCPPGRGIVLEATRAWAEWHKAPAQQAWRDSVLARHGQLQREVAAAFVQAGYKVDGALFECTGFKPPVHDDWDAFSW